MSLYTLGNLEKSLENFTLRVERLVISEGEVYSVLGSNGSGKTTLLNLLSFLAPPCSGILRYRDQRIDYASSRDMLLTRRKISYQMQNPYLFHLNVRDNIGYPLKLRKLPADTVKRKVDSVMSQLGLLEYGHRDVRSLSGGEAQRVALARTLVLDADVYLLDEPTAHVDKENIRVVEKVVLSLVRDRKATAVLTTHSRDQAHRMSRHILNIVNGRVTETDYANIFMGTLKEEADGLKTVAVSEGVKLVVSQGSTGTVTVGINPRDVILSHERFESSALNNFYGNISKVEEADGSLRIYIDTGVTFCAHITHRSFHGMGLNIGKKIWVTFKANSVRIFDD